MIVCAEKTVVSLIGFAVLTAEQGPNALAETRIGCYHDDLLNGVTFIRDDSLIVLLRIG